MSCTPVYQTGKPHCVPLVLPWEVEDGLWERIEPLLPVIEGRFRHPGRKRLDDRKALCGILFVLHTAIPWEFLPQELGLARA
jgi:transposase